MTTRTRVLSPYHPLAWQIAPWRDTSLVMLLSGGSGGGKSRLAAEKGHGFNLRYPGSVGLMVRKTLKAANRSCVPTMWKVIGGVRSGIEWNKADNTFRYPNGSMIYTGGMQDEDQRESVRSIGGDGGVDWIWVEEATALTEQDYNELLARLRHTAAPWRQIILTTNPDAPGHWINQRLIIGREAAVYESVASDNPHLPDSYFDTLKTLTGVQYQRLVLNKWVQAEGVVYDNFSVPDNVTEDAEYNPDWPVVWGVDDGYALGGGKGTESYHPRVFLLAQFTPQGGINVFAEYYKCLEVEEQSIQNVLDLGYPKPEIAYVDSSAAQLKARIWGMGVQTVGATHVVTEGIKNVRRLICDGNNRRLLKIHPRCKQLIDELQSYAYGDSMTSINGERKPLKLNDHGCFVAGTLVETDRGSVPIEDLKAGDYVLTRRGYQEIRVCGVTQIADVITITLNNSYVLTGTPDHPVWTENRGWVNLEDIGIDDIIQVTDSIKDISSCPRKVYLEKRSLSTTVLNTAATPTLQNGPTKFISDRLTRFIAKFGSTITAQSQKAMRFITGTEMLITTRLKILSACLSEIISRNMEKISPLNVENKCVKPCAKSVNMQDRGINQKKAESGIANTLSNMGLAEAHRLIRFAISAVNHMKPSIYHGLAFAPSGAGRQIGERRAQITKPVCVHGVEKISNATALCPQKHALVRVDAVTRVANSAPQIVYNLTVDAVPEYFANGVLVHNCDALRYASYRLRYE